MSGRKILQSPAFWVALTVPLVFGVLVLPWKYALVPPFVTMTAAVVAAYGASARDAATAEEVAAEDASSPG
ncbi:hypothetical protein AB0B89_03005 [Sphaerisporangium sp. NPDC049002]|uniref:hypothetical protein n=1 Tax=unclassified Sphaerisporangium TaxID=2630420 RepID=UPI0033FEDAB7